MTDQRAQLEALRQRLTATGADYWDAYMQAVGACNLLLPDVEWAKPASKVRTGLFVVFPNFDITQSRKLVERSDELYVTYADQRRRLWVVRPGGWLAKLLGQARDVQRRFGFGPESRMDLVGQVVEAERIGEMPDAEADGYLPRVEPRALWLDRQLAVFRHPMAGACIPGLEAAEGILREVRGSDRFEPVSDPRGLLTYLTQSLRDSNYDLFSKLWSAGDQQMMRRRYDRMREAFEAGITDLTFSHYDARMAPENYPGCREVKMFIQRQGPGTATAIKTMLVVQEQGEWRLKSGTI